MTSARLTCGVNGHGGEPLDASEEGLDEFLLAQVVDAHVALRLQPQKHAN